eukprot:GGOE01004960.1.p2 GENE.GGOE01004960.1~~GGOE01004960.1.p2  ORF type:complete len:399 (-),score=133.84 GGOE01004960.1:78-1274(-)
MLNVLHHMILGSAFLAVMLLGSRKAKYELRRRTLVILFDGTGEDRLYTHRPPTNIGRFADRVRKRHDPSTVIMYHRGVATSEEHGLPFSRIPGLITGKGIWQIVRDVYLSVVDNYRAGDTVFLLGYSRGAAAAWELASILDEFGVPRNPHTARQLAAHAFQKLRKRAGGKAVAALALEDRIPVRIKFLGLFDCVVATGALIHLNRLPTNIDAAYHAVAIDEQRRHFAPTLLPPGALEVWFSGCHGNVGGGSGCTLSDIALQWMLEMSARHGLEAAPRPANLEAVEKEIDQAWNNWLVRLSGEFRQRTIPEGAIVHSTVLRMISNTTYRPRNLPFTFRVLSRDPKIRFRWCNSTLLLGRKFDFNVTCGPQRPLTLPRIGEDRAAVQPPTEKSDPGPTEA